MARTIFARFAVINVGAGIERVANHVTVATLSAALEHQQRTDLGRGLRTVGGGDVQRILVMLLVGRLGKGFDWRWWNGQRKVSGKSQRQGKGEAKRAHADVRDKDALGDDSGGSCGVNAGLTFAVAFFDVGCRCEKRGETSKSSATRRIDNLPKETKTEKRANMLAPPYLRPSFAGHLK